MRIVFAIFFIFFYSCGQWSLISISGPKKYADQQLFLLEQYPSVYAMYEKMNDSSSQKVYFITPEQLKTALANEDQSLIYIWAPYCTGSKCYSLETIREQAAALQMKLYVVAEALNQTLIEAQTNNTSILFSMHLNDNKKRSNEMYKKEFIKNLTEQNEQSGRYIWFQNGKFVKTTEDIFEE